MRTGCMFFLFGLVGLVHSPVLPPVYLVILLPLCLFLGFRISILAWPMWFVCGVLWGVLRADIILQDQLSSELEGKHLTIEGVIVSLPVKLKGGQRFIFEVEHLLDEHDIEHPPPGRIRLNWFGVYEPLVPGDRWRLHVSLKRPHGFMNPGGFDYEAWLFQQRIRATGYVYRKTGNTRLREGEDYYLHRLRYLMREKLAQVLKEQKNAGLIPALVIGDRSSIQGNQWQVLTSTGTSHLLAISGLHIGLVASMVFFLTRWLWPLGRVTALVVPSPKIAAVMAMLAALAYAAMAGFSVPTQRALIMLLVLLVSALISRKVATSAVISLALLLVLVIDPFAVLSAGFWLSFGAIIVIAYGMSARVKTAGLWWRWGRVQYLVALGLSPLLVLWFQQVPVLSIAANLFIVPWVGFVTVPLVLLGSVMIWCSNSVGSYLLELGTGSINIFWPFLAYLGQLDFSVLALTRAGTMAVIVAVTGVSLLLMPSGLPGRWLGLVWVLPILFPVQEKMGSGEVHLTLLDVGQGTAAVIETANHLLLFDTGPRFSSRFDAGSAVIIPYLLQNKTRHLDLLVQSHGDNDHIGGLSEILKKIKVDQVLSSVPELIEHDNVAECVRGQVWYWDEVRFEILHPAGNNHLSGNNRSCVLKISNDDDAILLTGDIEAVAEQRILKHDRDKLHSTILLAPHHGSLTSSTSSFIAAVHAEYVLFPVGYRNRFGFPKQDIIRRYREADANILDTASFGAIDVHLGRGVITVRPYRQYAQRFWHEI